uniref:NADH dehydrogenase subunit 6 n=1 Tax=Oreohelix idahoensis TaxID=2584915 RepID=A0A4Y5P3B2_9EUPU|nr:NADH dehydrogenase subunit 6 [Oreohelix idahoensis]QCW57646.1 NADH dehydrogenase subunit 6 [Oreohelix idahoensis]UKG20809.1 NADH dehydrogenase subunit 6 [Oreohelix idahoensis]
MMYVIMSFWVFIISLYIISSSPMEYIFLTLALAFGAAIYLTVFFSSWFAMILFLIYVGGMMVLFIYLCMISSNFISGVSQVLYWKIFMMGALSIFISFFLNFNYKGIYNANLLLSGAEINLYIILFLVLLLLLVFFGLVNVLKPGGKSFAING